MTFSRTDTVCRAADVLSAVLDHDCILLDIDAAKYLQLNPVGAEIWKRVESPVSVGELCQQLYARFDAAPETIDRDVIAFLAKLEARGMVTRNAAP